MKILYPNPGELADDQFAALLGEHAPGTTRANMILSIDGATAVDGDSAPLSNASDRRIYKALRSQANGIVVGSKTATHPGYLKVAADKIVISNQGHVPHPSYICVTTEAGRARAQSQCERVIVTSGDRVNLREAWSALEQMGLDRLLCEGGATVLSSLLEVGLVDDLFLTIAPLVVGNDSPKLALPHPEKFRLVHLLEDSGYLFTRYAHAPSRTNAGASGATDSRRILYLRTQVGRLSGPDLQ